MKKVLLIAMAVTAVTACSKIGTTSEIKGEKEKLNILTSIGTRAVVAGVEMPKNSVIGVHVTQESDAKVYAGENVVGTNLVNGANVRFDNKDDAGVWVSQDAMGVIANLMIGKTVGTVYAYYPYAATVTGIGAAATIPATILQTGDIDLSAAPAKSVNYDGNETDYLFYSPVDTRNTVSTTTTTTTPLTMAHAMASISFRMYVANDAAAVSDGDDKYYLMGYTIKNKTGKSLFCADNTNVTMNISDGKLTTPNTGDEIIRTINNTSGYALTRVSADGTIAEAEKDALPWASNLVFPIANISHTTLDGVEVSNDIEVIFSIKKGSTGVAINCVLPLVVKTGISDKWDAGKNYQYTIKLSDLHKLGIEAVEVTNWVDVVGGDMEIK